MDSVLANDGAIVVTFSEPREQRSTLMLDLLPGGLQFSVRADSIRLEPRA